MFIMKMCDLSDVGPADIDVVAALGDHLVTGTAALANSTSDTFKDFPEVSFAMGGAGDWRTVTTLPNLLRQFNPNLIGFSAGNRLILDIASYLSICLSGSFTAKGFNFAKSSATSKDLEEQARNLLSAMESDKRIDMNTFWKVSD